MVEISVADLLLRVADLSQNVAVAVAVDRAKFLKKIGF